MKKLMILALFPASFSLAGTPPDFPNTTGIKVAGHSQEQIIKSAQRCIKSALKNKQFEVIDANSFFDASEAKSAKPLSSPDPTAILDTSMEEGKIYGRHIFTTDGFISEGIVSTDVTIETQPEKFRILWHDAVYSASIQPNWRRSQEPLIQEALPYKKAIIEIAVKTGILVSCISTTPPASDW